GCVLAHIQMSRETISPITHEERKATVPLSLEDDRELKTAEGAMTPPDGVAKNSADDRSAVALERQISPVGRRPHLRPSWLLQAPPEPSGKGTQCSPSRRLLRAPALNPTEARKTSEQHLGEQEVSRLVTQAQPFFMSGTLPKLIYLCSHDFSSIASWPHTVYPGQNGERPMGQVLGKLRTGEAPKPAQVLKILQLVMLGKDGQWTKKGASVVDAACVSRQPGPRHLGACPGQLRQAWAHPAEATSRCRG
ncbi:hypothetical protein DBR06_SOUSAS9210040, partial [Sousa chinensis]